MGMSEARNLPKGATYLVTRRCSDGRMLLRPDSWVAKVMTFCIAWAANFYEIELHAICIVSNHYHMVLTDTASRMPEFMAWVNRISSLFIALNRNRVGETTWDASEKYSAVMLLTEEAVWKELAYVTTNAVGHGLVKTYKDWGGFVTTPSDVLKKNGIKTSHPGRFVKKHKAHPLKIVKPKCFSHMTDHQYVAEYRRLVSEREAALRLALPKDKKGRRKVVGMKEVMRQSPTRPRKRTEKRYQITPTFAAVTAKGIEKGKKMVRAFRKAYGAALQAYRKGKRNVQFPYGTYKMRVTYNVNCATRH